MVYCYNEGGYVEVTINNYAEGASADTIYLPVTLSSSLAVVGNLVLGVYQGLAYTLENQNNDSFMFRGISNASKMTSHLKYISIGLITN